MGIFKPFKNSKRLPDELFYYAIDNLLTESLSNLGKLILITVYNESDTYTGFVKISLDNIHRLLQNKFPHAEIRIVLKQLIKEEFLVFAKKDYLGVNHDKLRLGLRGLIPEGILMLNDELSFLGFVVRNFSMDSYLWRDGNTIWISLVIAYSDRKGNFRKLIRALNEELGFDIAIPTPIGRMKEIVEKNNYQKYQVENGLADGSKTDDIWVLRSRLLLHKKEILKSA